MPFNSPWEYRPNGSDGGLDACFCLKGKSRADGMIDVLGNPDVAADVLRAVNSHNELVAALNAALLLADDEGDLPDNGEHCGAIIADQIRAALKKAAIPTQTMSEFFSRDDVKALQEIQKRNAYGSAEHRKAFEEIKRLAALVGASKWIGTYEN